LLSDPDHADKYDHSLEIPNLFASNPFPSSSSSMVSAPAQSRLTKEERQKRHQEKILLQQQKKEEQKQLIKQRHEEQQQQLQAKSTEKKKLKKERMQQTQALEEKAIDKAERTLFLTMNRPEFSEFLLRELQASKFSAKSGDGTVLFETKEKLRAALAKKSGKPTTTRVTFSVSPTPIPQRTLYFPNTLAFLDPEGKAPQLSETELATLKKEVFDLFTSQCGVREVTVICSGTSPAFVKVSFPSVTEMTSCITRFRDGQIALTLRGVPIPFLHPGVKPNSKASKFKNDLIQQYRQQLQQQQE